MKKINKKILILEDDLKTLSKILDKLYVIEENLEFEISLVMLTDYDKVEKYVNANPKDKFDIILLDRDSKEAGSFHVLDIDKFGPEKIISISSVPRYNEAAKERGVARVIYKDFLDLDTFSEQVMREILIMLGKDELLKEYGLDQSL